MINMEWNTIRKNKYRKTHGLSGTRIYRIWNNVLNRCRKENKYSPAFYKKLYVDPRWKVFENFFEDMSEGYKDNLSIDRINNKKGYFKENCRWATQSQQMNNVTSNVRYKGETAKDAGVRLSNNKHLVSQRLCRGWSIKRAFETPKFKNYGRKDYILKSKHHQLQKTTRKR